MNESSLVERSYYVFHSLASCHLNHWVPLPQAQKPEASPSTSPHLAGPSCLPHHLPWPYKKTTRPPPSLAPHRPLASYVLRVVALGPSPRHLLRVCFSLLVFAHSSTFVPVCPCAALFVGNNGIAGCRGASVPTPRPFRLRALGLLLRATFFVRCDRRLWR
jgi:hypothetical protein